MKTRTLRVAGWCTGLAVFALAADALEAAPAVVGSKLPCADSEVIRYTAHRVARPMVIDGKLDEPAWKLAPASSRYVDILTGAPAPKP